LEDFIFKTLACLAIVAIGVKWMAQDFARKNPDQADEIKKAASEKLASFVKDKLK
jgi:hypothetical protein